MNCDISGRIFTNFPFQKDWKYRSGKDITEGKHKGDKKGVRLKT